MLVVVGVFGLVRRRSLIVILVILRLLRLRSILCGII